MNISITFQESHAQVCALIADFREREAFYLSVEYQEAEARQDFIDKFWIALGWDVRHDRQKNPYEQEVKVERGISVVTGPARSVAAIRRRLTTPFWTIWKDTAANSRGC